MSEPEPRTCDAATVPCAACRGELPALRGAELAGYFRALAGRWRLVDEHHLENDYRFADFRRALAFTNRVGGLAEAIGHHPEIRVAWGSVGVRIWTYKQDALTRTDFVLAHEIDRLAAGSSEIECRQDVTWPQPPVETGLDVLRAARFAPLEGTRVGLVTNQTGRARDGASAIDLLFGARGVSLISLFSPEHGIRAMLDADVPSGVDEKTRLPVYSLYGKTRRPTAAMLRSLDAVVIDLQDVGARFYTYSTTMAYVMEEAAKHGVRVFVLDRPNPIGGLEIEGPALDECLQSFVGCFPPMPVRHGMTLGELAKLFNEENGLGVDLTVIAMRHWRRAHWFDQTGLPWIRPSPSMGNLHEATLYPGSALLEYSNVSVGRGTSNPFEQIGAPWIDGVALADELNRRAIPGIRFYPVRFTPVTARHQDRECGGIFVIVIDRSILRPVRVGVEIAAAIRRLYGRRFDCDASAPLLGSRHSIERIKYGEDPLLIAASWADAESRFRAMRAPYLIY